MMRPGTQLPLRRASARARASLALLWLGGALLAPVLCGCGASASPRWAGGQPVEQPAPPEPAATRPVKGEPAPRPVVAPDTGVATASRELPPPELNPALREEGPAEAEVTVPGLVPSGGGYRIGSGDELVISLPYEREVPATNVKVRTDGMITAPMLQEVRAAGRTPAELDSVLLIGYSRIFRYPAATVAVSHIANNMVYILGEVNVPGGMEIPGSMSLVQLIAKAGGMRSSGTLKSVVLLRRGSGNRVLARRVNVARILEGEPDSPDVMLAPSDIVFVPRSFIGKLNLFVEQYITNLINPITTGYIHGWEVLSPDRFFVNPNYTRPSQTSGVSVGP
jgi:protein involved in polysaccharide export with SLBB domain